MLSPGTAGVRRKPLRNYFSSLSRAATIASSSFESTPQSFGTAMYKQSFDEAVTLARKEIMRITSHRPAILSGGFPYMTYDRWTQNLGRTLRNYQP